MDRKIIFHIDVNSAFLSWEAAYRKTHGIGEVDLRDIPSIVGGDTSKRKGIVLAKSVPAKKYGIKTGEPVAKARELCPNLVVVSPTFGLYAKYSDAFVSMLKEYSPLIEQYSVDECFIDMSGYPSSESPAVIADKMRRRIFSELGFSVNVGISNNKLLAKMASEFEKPNKTHTLFPDEIKEKMWPLDVGEMFMVGKQTCIRLKNMGINTIGELAQTPIGILTSRFGSARGMMLKNYANGIDFSEVETVRSQAKSISNSTTLAYDISKKEEAYLVILSLCESIGKRLREKGLSGKVLNIYYKKNDFKICGKSKKYPTSTQCTREIYKHAIELFDEIYKGEQIRAIGVCVEELSDCNARQLTFFEETNKYENVDAVIDSIRCSYGNTMIMRGGFINNDLTGFSGSSLSR